MAATTIEELPAEVFAFILDWLEEPTTLARAGKGKVEERVDGDGLLPRPQHRRSALGRLAARRLRNRLVQPAQVKVQTVAIGLQGFEQLGADIGGC